MSHKFSPFSFILVEKQIRFWAKPICRKSLISLHVSLKVLSKQPLTALFGPLVIFHRDIHKFWFLFLFVFFLVLVGSCF